MKKFSLTLTVLAAALLSAACTSTPTTSKLDMARADYRAVQENPLSGSYAPLETKQAGDALALANDAAANYQTQDHVDHLAYLAQQKISLSREVMKQKLAEAQIAQSGVQRDQLLLNQRTAEADQSKRNATAARNDASEAKRNTQIALNEAKEAKQGAQAAKAEAAEAKQGTQNAQMESAEAQKLAQAAQARSAKLEAALAALSAKKTEHGIVITLNDVLFGTDLSRLTADGIRSAQKLATLLQDEPQRKVLVEGFTDSTGTASHNQALSERRANAVRSALVDLGVAADRIAVRGYGEELAVAANNTAANRQLNRRVEIVLSDDQGVITPR